MCANPDINPSSTSLSTLSNHKHSDLRPVFCPVRTTGSTPNPYRGHIRALLCDACARVRAHAVVVHNYWRPAKGCYMFASIASCSACVFAPLMLSICSLFFHCICRQAHVAARGLVGMPPAATRGKVRGTPPAERLRLCSPQKPRHHAAPQGEFDLGRNGAHKVE